MGITIPGGQRKNFIQLRRGLRNAKAFAEALLDGRNDFHPGELGFGVADPSPLVALEVARKQDAHLAVRAPQHAEAFADDPRGVHGMDVVGQEDGLRETIG